MGKVSDGRKDQPNNIHSQESCTSYELSSAATFDDLQVGMRMYGIVSQVKRFSALIDIGVGQKAFVSVSEIKRCGARSAKELLKVGYVVFVEIKRIDTIGRRVSVSLPLTAMKDAKGNGSKGSFRNKRSGFQKERRRSRNKKVKKRPLSPMPNPQFLKSQTTRTAKKIVLPIKNQAGFSNSSNDWDDLAWKNRFGKKRKNTGF
ncbi:MAG: S1 RNA-binding domain-containing protein [Anaerolineaceae bacterium]|nr:S1 RNA-binding domain-containing protein [Anaerolineaceae bacterium]